ncbi:thioredoxin family protein [Flammeovirga agarivorans]|uniref:Thioredoxin family protein n=1 Tax=Flammeovirga agarivorans TaxID=2726742 RepID=A0A7X8SHB8_9BACT|nr:thioredoxin family protein [Flammeovirga agarivorans]NLR90231.1 thioredoxin family protein [Flammeovirga agarivorans]
MKYFILTSSILFLLNTAFGQSVNFERGDWGEIISQAKEDHKLIYVSLSPSWCESCKSFDEDVYHNKFVSDYFNSHFVSIKRDLDDPVAKEFVSKYKVRSYPTHLFFDQKGNLVHMFKGGMPANIFLDKSEEVHDPSKQVFTLKKRIKDNEKLTYEEYLNYCIGVFDLGLEDDRTTDLFLSKLNASSFKDKRVVNVVSHALYHSDANAYAFEVFKKYHEQIKENFPPQTLNSIYSKIGRNILGASLKENNPLMFEKDMYTLKKYIPVENAAVIFFELYPKFYLSIGEDDKAFYSIQNTFQEVKHYQTKKIVNSCNDWAWYFCENSEDNERLQAALSWVNYGLSMADSYDLMDTQAHLYFKLGMVESSKSVAEKVLKHYQKTGKDTAQIAFLMQQITVR